MYISFFESVKTYKKEENEEVTNHLVREFCLVMFSRIPMTYDFLTENEKSCFGCFCGVGGVVLSYV